MVIPPSKILRREQVQELTSLGRSTLFALVAQGRFPRPIKLSPRRVGWVWSEVEAWMAHRVSERDAQNVGETR